MRIRSILKIGYPWFNLLVFIIFIIIFLNSTFLQSASITLISKDTIWKYLDDGSNQGTAWKDTTFIDPGWSIGTAELGYGDGDETTMLGYGGNPNNKYITTYFRHTFNVASTSGIFGLNLNILRDDGAVVYLNGTEVYRTNMPGGSISYTTLASSAVALGDESTYYSTSINTSNLITGSNLLAVELHQANITSSDISFNLELIASSGTLTRGPYLQMGSSTSIIVRWRTDIDTNSRVSLGTTLGNLTNYFDSSIMTTEHIIPINGLLPDTKYYYSIGTQTEVFEGDDSNHFFITSPLTGTSKPTRIWVLGDSGTANDTAMHVRDAYYTYTGSTHTDLWLMLGDNAYYSGTDPEFQAAVFDMYPTMLKKSVLWATLGNHDAVSADSPTETGPYYNNFSLPKNAEAGGLMSGTEAYYSFDYGNIHFICLDSHDTDRSTTGTMYNWLKNDLISTMQDWIIAFWHHPPYSKGSHNSDSLADSGGRMQDMRQNFLPLLESGGVDLVLTGHSHAYERSYLLDGHYGHSSTFNINTMALDSGNGKIDGTGAYQKPSGGPMSHKGAVYVVAGSSGQISGGSLNHPVMYISLNQLASLIIDVNLDILTVTSIGTTTNKWDYFTIDKSSTMQISDWNTLSSSPNLSVQNKTPMVVNTFIPFYSRKSKDTY